MGYTINGDWQDYTFKPHFNEKYSDTKSWNNIPQIHSYRRESSKWGRLQSIGCCCWNIWALNNLWLRICWTGSTETSICSRAWLASCWGLTWAPGWSGWVQLSLAFLLPCVSCCKPDATATVFIPLWLMRLLWGLPCNSCVSTSSCDKVVVMNNNLRIDPQGDLRL